MITYAYCFYFLDPKPMKIVSNKKVTILRTLTPLCELRKQCLGWQAKQTFVMYNLYDPGDGLPVPQ